MMSRFLSAAKQTAAGWSAVQVSTLLTAVALALWAYSLAPIRLEIGHLGLISSFPVVFFVALGILTLAAVLLWTSPDKHHKLLFLQLMVLIAAVWLIPMLIGTRPYFHDAQRNLLLIDGIIAQGGLFDTGYLDWPGAFLLFSMLGKLESVSFDSVMNISSFIMLLLYLPLLYVFLRNVLGESRGNLCWAGLWVFSLASWVPEGYFSPQGVAYLLLLTVLALLTSAGFWQAGRRWLPLTAAVVVAGAALAVTHLLTTALVIGTLAVVSVAKKSLRAVPAIVAVAALAVLWNAGVTDSAKTEIAEASLFTLDASATDVGMLSLDIASMVERQVLERVTGSQSHVDVARLRVAFSAVVAGLAVAGVAYLLMKRKWRTAILLIAIAVVPFLMLPISGRHYVETYATRMYFFVVPAMACAAVLPLKGRKRLVVPIFWAIWAAAIPLTMIAQYGNQVIDRWSPGYRAGVSYVAQMRAVPEYYPVAWHWRLALDGDRVVLDNGRVMTGSYVPISEHDDLIYSFKYDRPEFVDRVWGWLRSSGAYEHIYANPEFGLYLGIGEE